MENESSRPEFYRTHFSSSVENGLATWGMEMSKTRGREPSKEPFHLNVERNTKAQKLISCDSGDGKEGIGCGVFE